MLQHISLQGVDMTEGFYKRVWQRAGDSVTHSDSQLLGFCLIPRENDSPRRSNRVGEDDGLK